MYLVEKVKAFTDEVVETRKVETEEKVRNYIIENLSKLNEPFYRMWHNKEYSIVDYGSHLYHIRYKKYVEKRKNRNLFSINS